MANDIMYYRNSKNILKIHSSQSSDVGFVSLVSLVSLQLRVLSKVVVLIAVIVGLTLCCSFTKSISNDSMFFVSAWTHTHTYSRYTYASYTRFERTGSYTRFERTGTPTRTNFENGDKNRVFQLESSKHSNYNSESDDNSNENESNNIVILGGGFAGLNTALTLDSLFKKNVNENKNKPKIILVDDKERFVFLPLLYELCVGDAEVSYCYYLYIQTCC